MDWPGGGVVGAPWAGWSGAAASGCAVADLCEQIVQEEVLCSTAYIYA